MIKQKETIIRLLEALFPGVKIYLFGSFARGDQRPGSDIDLALDAGKKIDILEISRAREILAILPIAQKVDLVDLNFVSQEFKEVILKESIIWKQ